MLVLQRPISLTHNPKQRTAQKQSYFTSDPQTGKKKKNYHGMYVGISEVSRSSNYYQDFFLMHLLAQWKAKPNTKNLLTGNPRHQGTKLGILRYYTKFHVFTGVLLDPQKKHSVFLEAKDAVLSFWQCLSLCWAQSKCLINTCQSADGMFKHLPLAVLCHKRKLNSLVRRCKVTRTKR